MSSAKEIWVLGKYIECELCKRAWEIMGVFDNKDLAIEACTKEDYFIGPLIMNNKLPHEHVEWTGAYYPLLEDGPRK